MAKFNSYLLGQMANSVGNVTMCRLKNMNIVKGKTLKVRNPRTEKQVAQRTKMRVLVELAGAFAAPLLAGHPRRNLSESWNLFVKQNMGHLTVDDKQVATVDYPSLEISAGCLQKPIIEVKLQDADRKITFTKKEQLFSLLSQKTDQIWGVLYESKRNEILQIDLKKREEFVPVEVTLPEGWQMENVSSYAFAASADGIKASPTVRFTL